MLADHFEDFVLLEPTRQEDGMGGAAESWTDSMRFRGGITAVPGSETSVAGLSALRTSPALLHDWDVTLIQGDRIRRLRDGAEYRVTGQSDDMRTPVIASFAFCQVPVERLVTAP